MNTYSLDVTVTLENYPDITETLAMTITLIACQITSFEAVSTPIPVTYVIGDGLRTVGDYDFV